MKLIVRISALVCLTATVSLAQQPAPAPGIVRQAVQKELDAANDPTNTYLYRLKRETKSGVLVRDLVETKDGIVSRSVTWNGRQLTPEERAKDDAKLQKILTSKEEQRKRFSEQHADAERILRMVRALPEASLYTPAGTETVNGRLAVRFNFVPNPEYEPTSRELIAFKQAEGSLWIDKADTRVVRFDAHLVNDINIGFGFLGHIDKGGSVHMEQQIVSGGRWRITTLTIDATGNALVFKTLTIKQRQWGSNFRLVPQMSIAQAIELLKQQDVTK
jgi:hypothetical protein